ncbi:MAG: hypothetical protein J6K58_13160 [Lachnospiraceae bacterium]|nr:hypothetical protein [Lachnospiraceae bacterium]
MNHGKGWGKKPRFLKILILLFTVSVSMTVVPCHAVNSHGLFGEITAFSVSETETESEVRSVSGSEHEAVRSKGRNVFQIYFLLIALIVVFIWLDHVRELPVKETIVTLKIRMNN